MLSRALARRPAAMALAPRALGVPQARAQRYGVGSARPCMGPAFGRGAQLGHSMAAAPASPSLSPGARSFFWGKKEEEEVDSVKREAKAIEKLGIKEIKNELNALGVAHNDLFEKPEFVQRLAEARVKAQQGGGEEAVSVKASEARSEPRVKPEIIVDKDPESHRQDSSGGGGFGGGGFPFGGAFDGKMKEMMMKIMNNPEAMKVLQKAAQSPRVLAAVQEIMKNPMAMAKHASDPEITGLVNELRKHVKP